MKKTLISLVIFSFVFMTSSYSNTVLNTKIKTKKTKEYICKIIKVSDGDTANCKTSNNLILKIRFYGIDAPESKQDFGRESTYFLKNKIFDKTVKVISHEKDRYGRTVGTVYLNNENINHYMVANGYAWVYKEYNKDYKLIELENKARENKLGLWNTKNPIYPSQYRKGKRV